jgi:hypothetical protein
MFKNIKRECRYCQWIGLGDVHSPCDNNDCITNSMRPNFQTNQKIINAILKLKIERCLKII